jgi:RecA/RadA recombinase
MLIMSFLQHWNDPDYYIIDTKNTRNILTMSLLDKIKKNSTIKETAVLSKSKFFNKKDMIQTSVPAINIALSGSLDGGLTPGLTTIAGPSRHFKTLFSLIMAKAYLDKYPEAVLLFYDSEFGTPQAYFSSVGIDLDRVLHSPISDIEQLKFDLSQQVAELTHDDKVIILIDSVGNLASKKEVEDALDGKSTVDMSRAKQLKSLFRIVTPSLTIKDVPLVVINHTYKTMELYSKDVVSGGTGSIYSSDTIWIIGRQQEKDGSELAGYNFVINVEKSRYVREKSKIPITVKFEGGISKWSGLLDIALESGHVVKPSNGWYSKVNTVTGEIEDKKYRIKDTDSSEFWNSIILDKSFSAWIKQNYQVSHGALLANDTVPDKDIETAFVVANEEE